MGNSIKKILGVEFGSTRIKAVLIDERANVIAQGVFEWENKFENGLWTYALDEVWNGVRHAYKALCQNYGEPIKMLDGIGISAMMHGYLAFDKNDCLLTPFRTWRNTNTEEAAEELTKQLDFNMPQRWSATHYYQAVLNGEAHVGKAAFLTTLAGYVHWRLTGRKVLGIGDASGMFPVRKNAYDLERLEKYNALLSKRSVNKKLQDLLPEILLAGEEAGRLTEAGAKLLDESGNLQAGVPFCPPEGDAGTGMVATNAVKERTGNVSAGTSAFAMIVMDKQLSKVYPEIDVVTTPTGKPVAMVHVNNFTCEINAWTRLFEEVAELAGVKLDKDELLSRLFRKSKESDGNVGGLLGYNYLSGEPIVHVKNGRPVVIRNPEGNMTLANFMQMQIYSALGALRLGMDILKAEKVEIEDICGHGGFFKTTEVSASAMSAAIGAPVNVLQNAGEGGAWGIAILALYAVNGRDGLEDFLAELFKTTKKITVRADEVEKSKFSAFMDAYQKGLAVERLAAEVF